MGSCLGQGRLQSLGLWRRGALGTQGSSTTPLGCQLTSKGGVWASVWS